MSKPSKSSNQHGKPESSSYNAANNQPLSSLIRRQLSLSTLNLFDDYHRFDGSREADQHTDAIVVRSSYPHTLSTKGGNAHNRARTSRGNKSRAPQAPVAGVAVVPNPVIPSGGGRLDKSLGHITERFFDLIKQASDGIVDLTEAAETLQVRKRRMYDVTNVLEGIGLIEKCETNKVLWKGAESSGPGEMERELYNVQAEVGNLKMEESILDEKIREMEQKLITLSVDEKSRKWLYITEEDIKSLPQFQNKTVIAVRAPQGAKLEVPYPDEGVGNPERSYKINISSSTGPIDVFPLGTIENYEEEEFGYRQPNYLLASSSGGKENRGIEVITLDSPSRDIGTQAEHCYVQSVNFPLASGLGANETRGIDGITLASPNKEIAPQAEHTNQMPSKYITQMVASEVNCSQDSSSEIPEFGLPDPCNGLDYLFSSDDGLSASNLWSRDFMRSLDFLSADIGITDFMELSSESQPPGTSQMPCPFDFTLEK